MLIRFDDTVQRNLYNRQLVGKVIALNDDGSALIDLEPPIIIAGEPRKCVNAMPRHTGYDFFRLCLGFIAVNLFTAQSDIASNGQVQASFAIASMKIFRRTICCAWSRAFAKLRGRNVMIRSNDVFPEDVLAVIREVDLAGKTVLLELVDPIVFKNHVFGHAVAKCRLHGEDFGRIITAGVLSCGVTWIPNNRFSVETPFDLNWWRGGFAAITDLVLL